MAKAHGLKSPQPICQTCVTGVSHVYYRVSHVQLASLPSTLTPVYIGCRFLHRFNRHTSLHLHLPSDTISRRRSRTSWARLIPVKTWRRFNDDGSLLLQMDSCRGLASSKWLMWPHSLYC